MGQIFFDERYHLNIFACISTSFSDSKQCLQFLLLLLAKNPFSSFLPFPNSFFHCKKVKNETTFFSHDCFYILTFFHSEKNGGNIYLFIYSHRNKIHFSIKDL